MAITYDYKDKCGTATFESSYDGKTETYEVSLYTGNCFLIMVREFTENGNNMEQLHSFFVSEEHLIRCLEDDIFSNGIEKLVGIRINMAKCRNWDKISVILGKYVDGIKIELYREGDQSWKVSETEIPDVRMREIAEEAIGFMYDNGILEDFMDDTYIEFTDGEKSYFMIN